MAIHEETPLWQRTVQMGLLLAKAGREADSDETREIASLLQDDVDEVLLALERAVADATVSETLRSYRRSLVGTLRLKREAMASSYLGLLKQDTFTCLEKEIDEILKAISQQIRHLRFLKECHNPEIGYSHRLLQW